MSKVVLATNKTQINATWRKDKIASAQISVNLCF